MEKFNKSMIGKKVRFINAKAHELEPDYYPAVGTIGTIVPITSCLGNWGIRWPEGSVYYRGVEDDRNTWFCDEKSIELVDSDSDSDHMTDEEIFQMLMPKLKKNNVYEQVFESYGYELIYAFFTNDVMRAIALAYRSGYGRGKKGRPFKIGGDVNC